MRIVLEDKAVLTSPRFALISVTENVFWLGRFFGHERPLHAGGKTSTTATAKIRGFHLADDAFAAERNRFLDGLVAVEFQVANDVASAFTKALRDDLYLIGM